jgi:hypothetical protein
VRWFKAVPSRKLGFHNSSLCKELTFEFGIICPYLAREAIPQPAGRFFNPPNFTEEVNTDTAEVPSTSKYA